MSEMTEEERFKVIPACRRCKTRKIRCNRGAPKCGNCTKTSSACIIVDPITNENYPRDYIRQLEDKERQLREKIEGSVTQTTATTSGANDEEAVEESPESAQSTASTARLNGFVGDGSGLSFLRFIFSDAKWQIYKSQVLEHLTERPQIPEQAVSRNAQPSIGEAHHLLDNYFERFHINHTFLLRQDVLDVFNRVYHPTPSHPPSAQDHFRLFMVFAISAVTRFRKGLSQEHPYGYYLAAQAYLGTTPLLGTLDAIQNLLLVSRFGMYHHIGSSLWEISQFCMRQCIECRLHAKPEGRVDILKEQHHRRIFWECYILDRYSSGVLGRPFAISERDISVQLPVDASDEYLQQFPPTQSLTDVVAISGGQPTELSVFVFCIHLRRITSRIHSEFYNGRNMASISGAATPMQHVSSGRVYVKLHQFLEELQTWRLGAPKFAEPRTLYERPEWYDFMHEKDRLLLVRGAIHTAPRRNGHPPDDLLVMCLDCATRVIELYSNMMENKWITWTRSYFQVIFAAGLSIIYCISLGVHKEATGPMGRQQPTRTLALCGDILRMFKAEMPDAGRFAIVFEVLKDNFHRDSAIQPQGEAPEDISGMPLMHVAMDQRQPEYEATAAVDSMSGMQIPVQSWPSDVNSMLYPLAGGLPSPINTDHDQIPGFGLQPAVSDQDMLLDWPMLTDEMMEHLEAGLGEFAWDTVGAEGYVWDQPGWEL